MKKNKFGDYRKNLQIMTLAGYVVHVIFTDDIKKSCLARYGNCSARESAMAFVRHSTFEGRTHMFFPLNANEGTIAHEAYHVVHAMFDWCGVREFDNEMVAYHLGYLVEEIHKFKTEVKNHVSKAEAPRGTATVVQGLHTGAETKTP